MCYCESGRLRMPISGQRWPFRAPRQAKQTSYKQQQTSCTCCMTHIDSLYFMLLLLLWQHISLSPPAWHSTWYPEETSRTLVSPLPTNLLERCTSPSPVLIYRTPEHPEGTSKTFVPKNSCGKHEPMLTQNQESIPKATVNCRNIVSKKHLSRNISSVVRSLLLHWLQCSHGTSGLLIFPDFPFLPNVNSSWTPKIIQVWEKNKYLATITGFPIDLYCNTDNKEKDIFI